MRMQVVLASLALAASTPVSGQVQTQQAVVYLVRHAETAPDGTQDPPLSAQGRARAEKLTTMLGAAGLTAVHSTGYKRTRETAEAVGRATGLTPDIYDPRNLPALAEHIRATGGRHLVVGHSNTTPALVDLLGGDPGQPITESEYGRVYVVTLSGGEPRTALLGYPAEAAPDAPAAPSPAATPPADPGDVASIDSIIAATYDVLTGPKGVPRDWDRFRSLFLPTARMLPVQRAPDGRVVYRPLTVEEYIRSSGPLIEEIGFTEREIARQVEHFGDVAHVFSTYEGVAEDGAFPMIRGLNSIQLIHDGSRWWIASIAWSPERPDLPIPPRYR